MKKTSFLLLLIVCVPLITSSCSKENPSEKFDFNQLWWKGDTFGGNTTMYIQFISDSEFNFKDEGKGDRPSFVSGKGKYTRNGSNVTFDFETYDTGFARAYIQLLSGTWDKFPTTKEEARNAKFTVKGLHWVNLGGVVDTDKEEWTKTMEYDFKQNGW